MNKLDFLCRGYSESEHKWFEGYYFKQITSRPCFSNDPDGAKHYIIYIDVYGDWGMKDQLAYVEVDPKTLVCNTGFRDMHRNDIYEGDLVVLLNQIGEVVFECGCWGIGFKAPINYDALLKELGYDPEYSQFDGCLNDYFLSFYELTSNFDWGSDKILERVAIIGNRIDGITNKLEDTGLF